MHDTWEPKNQGRFAGLLHRILSFHFESDDVPTEIEQWEVLVKQYEDQSKEKVTDNVPSSIPVEYNGHYTVLGKLDVTEGLEPNTRIIGFYLFGSLEVIGSAPSSLFPKLRRLRTEKGWVTFRPTMLEKMEPCNDWATAEPALEVAAEEGALPRPSHPAARKDAG